jgi:leader peptidase (prepilin peptidase)/N-methyltransferase
MARPARAAPIYRRRMTRTLSNALLAAWTPAAAAAGLAVGTSSAALVRRWPVSVGAASPAAPAREGVWTIAVIGASGGLAGVVAATFGPTWRALATAVLLLALVPVVAVDLRHRLVPDAVVVPAAGLGLAATVAADPARWWVPPLAAAGAGGALALLWALSPDGMGLGDAKLGALMGAVLGAAVVPALALAFAAGGVAALAVLARLGRRARRLALPFAPFLAGGALVAVWWGDRLAAAASAVGS